MLRNQSNDLISIIQVEACFGRIRVLSTDSTYLQHRGCWSGVLVGCELFYIGPFLVGTGLPHPFLLVCALRCPLKPNLTGMNGRLIRIAVGGLFYEIFVELDETTHILAVTLLMAPISILHWGVSHR